jgi:hypothetical protein
MARSTEFGALPVLYLSYSDTLQKPILDIIEHRVVFDNGKILSLGLKLLVRVNACAKALLLLRLHATHLLGHLAGSYGKAWSAVTSEVSASVICHFSDRHVPLSLPRRKLNTLWRPKIHKKYQLILDIHLGSISLVMTPA